MDYEHVIALLETAGNDPRTFNERSVKTLDNLHTETLREIELVIGKRGRVTRQARSSKLLIRTERECLVEEFRICNGKRVIRKVGGPFPDMPAIVTVSETALKGEAALECILRGLSQEFKMELIDSSVIKPHHPYSEPLIDYHESTVFADIDSEYETTWYEWVIPKRFGEDTMTIKDYTDENHLRWIPF